MIIRSSSTCKSLAVDVFFGQNLRGVSLVFHLSLRKNKFLKWLRQNFALFHSSQAMVFHQLDLQFSQKKRKNDGHLMLSFVVTEQFKKIVSQHLMFLDTKRQRFTQVDTHIINNFISKVQIG